jgi:hypothetical protein
MVLERKSSHGKMLRVQLRKVLLRFSLNKRKLWHSSPLTTSTNSSSPRLRATLLYARKAEQLPGKAEQLPGKAEQLPGTYLT